MACVCLCIFTCKPQANLLLHVLRNSYDREWSYTTPYRVHSFFFWQPHNPHKSNYPPTVQLPRKPRWYMSRAYSNKFEIKEQNPSSDLLGSFFFLPFWRCFHIFKGTSRWRGRRWCCHKFSKQTVIFLLAVRGEKPNYERSLSGARLITVFPRSLYLNQNCTIEKSE